jgi:hypothetical protein
MVLPVRGEENLVASNFGVFKVDSFYFDECKIALTILGRADLSRDGIAGPQIELADLRRGNIDVVGAREVVVLRGAQEAKAIGEAFQDAFRKD